MDPQSAVDLVREAVLIALLPSAPALITATVVGLLMGLLQAVTQIQEQSLSFVPKLVAAVVVLTVSLPWLLTRMIDYFCGLVEGIPASL